MIALKEYTGKKKKTADDMAKIYRLDWEVNIYHNAELGPYVPGRMIDATLRDAARMSRRGKDIERGVSCMDEEIPIQYKGERFDLNKMYPTYADTRMTIQVGKAVMRTRPKFDQWSISFTVGYSPELIDRKVLLDCMHTSGRLLGIGAYRPRFGRFDVKSPAK